MGNAPPISAQQLKQLRNKYDKDGNGDLSWEEFKALALEVGQLQGLKTPVSEEKLQKIFQGLDADSSGSVNFQEFEAAHAKLQEQLQAAAKAKAKAKPKAKAEGKAKAKPKPKAKAPAADAVAENQASIFDSLPGFDSFIPTIGVPDLGVSSLFAEDSRVPVAKAIPTPKKTKPPPLPEPPPAPLNSQAPWSAQLKAADPDWYDPDDAEFSGSDDFPDVGEVPEEPSAPPAAPAAPAAPQAPPKAEPKPEAKAKPKAKGEAKAKPKADAKAKAKVKPKAKPQVNQLGQLKEPKGRAEGVSPLEGVTEDVFSSPIHRREAVAHPPDKRDPRVVRAMQMPSGMEMIEQEQEVLSEPESRDSVDSISGEVTRSWDPTAKDAAWRQRTQSLGDRSS
ncbi:unnamed protein product [Effrenium voratum]|nr:unnamed protein product [Effrenium voratum]